MQSRLAAFALGVIGCAVLISLGTWQLNRHVWKQEIIAQIEARIDEPPTTLPAIPDSVRDRFKPVLVQGKFYGRDLFVLTSLPNIGPVHRLISALMTTDGRQILIDRGWIPANHLMRNEPNQSVEIVGNLHWPDEVDSWTPEPDRENGIWFGRDVGQMAHELGTEPLMVIARTVSAPAPIAIPLPLTTTAIPNSHLGYAIQWYGLAIVWAGMTAFLIWRIHRRMV
ncbi:MAG: SURF1 family protein [Boseongicola sp.]